MLHKPNSVSSNEADIQPDHGYNRTTLTLLVLLVALAGIPRLILIFSGPQSLIQFVPDDAYYYVQVAKHVLAGDGSTFDGIHPTNGYHPLWFILVLLPAWAIQNQVILAEVILCMSTVMVLLSGVFLFMTLRILIPGYSWLQWTGTAAYLFNPQILFASLNGLETGLANLIFMCLIYEILRRIGKDEHQGSHDIILGFLMAMLFLARTDTILYIASLFFWLQLRNTRIQSSIRMAAVAMLFAFPYVLWNWISFGSFVQSSGTAIPFRFHQNFLLDGNTHADLIKHSFKGFFAFLRADMSTYLGFPFNILPLLGIGSFYVVRIRWKQIPTREKQFMKLFFALLGAGLGLAVIHSAVRWYAREWYFSQFILVCIILLATSAGYYMRFSARTETGDARTSRRKSRTLIAQFFVITVLIISGYGFSKLAQAPPFPHQKQMLRAAEWLKNNTTEAEIIGSFNSGIFSFFSGRTVVNLDGAINSAAYAAIRKRELLLFMRDSDIQIYLDYPLSSHLYRHFFGKLQSIVTFSKIGEIPKQGERGWESMPIQIFRIQWPEEHPEVK